MSDQTPASQSVPGQVVLTLPQGKRGCLYYGCAGCGAVLLVILLTALITAWWMNRQVNAAPFEPVALSAPEEQAFEEKIQRIEFADPDAEQRRPIVITERELNAWFNEQTQLGNSVYLDFINEGLRAKINIPLEEDAPIFPGRTLRAALTLRIFIENGRLHAIIQSFSVGGIPLPRAWLGELQGADLAELYLQDDHSMSRLVDGIESFDISRDQMQLMLAE